MNCAMGERNKTKLKVLGPMRRCRRIAFPRSPLWRMMRAAASLSSVAVIGIEAVSAETVVVTADRDTTLYEDQDGSLSNGSGPDVFTGTTASGAIRRALVRFDVAGAVPSGASVVAVSLTMHVSRTMAGPVTIALHPVTTAWGEGASVATSGGGGGGD